MRFVTESRRHGGCSVAAQSEACESQELDVKFAVESRKIPEVTGLGHCLAEHIVTARCRSAAHPGAMSLAFAGVSATRLPENGRDGP